jgi:rRNA maturation endonuclease Nob1
LENIEKQYYSVCINCKLDLTMMLLTSKLKKCPRCGCGIFKEYERNANDAAPSYKRQGGRAIVQGERFPMR